MCATIVLLPHMHMHLQESQYKGKHFISLHQFLSDDPAPCARISVDLIGHNVERFAGFCFRFWKALVTFGNADYIELQIVCKRHKIMIAKDCDVFHVCY